MVKRAKGDLERYYELYNVHRNDMSNYDYVLDTSDLTPEEVLIKIKEEYKKWKEI